MNKIMVLGIIGLFIGAGFVLGIAGNIEASNINVDKLDQNNSEIYGYGGWDIDFYSALAQSFKPSLSILTRVELPLQAKQNKDFADSEIILSIRSDINGVDLTKVAVRASNISTGFNEWIDFDFPDINVTPEENYYIVCYYDYYPGILWGSGQDDYKRGEFWRKPLNPSDPWYMYVSHHNADTSDLFFKTYGINHPPGKPTIKGPTEVDKDTKYYYSFTSIDADNDDLNYIIHWGDDTGKEHIGPSPSGTPVVVEHKWEKGGTYYIEAQAIDKYGIESGWTILKISMPKTKEIYNPLLRFLENHPSLFPLLRQLLEL